ncbi:MAG: hypothetical protein ACNA70_04645 [Brevefilum sp.]
MATPRRPQDPQKPNSLAILFAIGILGGAIWLIMLIFGLGPYAIEPIKATRTLTPTDILISGVTQAPPELITSTPTLTPTFAPEILPPTITPSPTRALLPYILIGEPEYMSSALIRPSLGCDWLIIAGQVWNLQDAPVRGLSLHLFGALDGYTIDRFSLTGSAPDYGQSGYEFQLENLSVDSQDTLFIQLFDADGNALSNPYGLETFNDCQKNLILVNFKQVR